ncbi:hypothetical protein LTR40_009957 [Exophiala xenobiotica]|nr:hypothetical protein LTR40_009957 [Exophiala xenobiotica]
MIKDDADFVAGLPKAELHIHLEGALEPGLVRKLAARNGIVVPSAVTERSVGYDFHDLPSFLAVYYGCMGVLQTEDDFFDLCYSYLHKVHSQNVVHVEMFFDPQAHTRRGIAFSTVLGGYRRAIVTAQRELNISASLIMCFLRDLDPVLNHLLESNSQFIIRETVEAKLIFSNVRILLSVREQPPRGPPP